MGRLDGDGAEVDAQVLGQRLRVGAGVVAGEARRHGHAVHVVGPDGVDRHHGHQRGVDAARQADHHVGEPVLHQVVAGAEHDGPVHLLVGVEGCGQGGRSQRGPVGPGPGLAVSVAVDGHGGDHLHGEQVVGGAAPGVQQALAVHGVDVQVDDQQVLHELRGAGDHLTVGVEHHGPAVEHQLVLATDLVHVHQRARRVGGAGGHEPLPERQLALGVGRSVEVHDELGAAVGLVEDGPRRVPRVLADAHPHPNPAHRPQAGGLPAVGEVALFVEHGVVGQVALVVHPAHLAVGAHRGCVPQVSVHVDEPHHRHAPPGVGRHLLQRSAVVGDEAGLEQQVLRRVAGDGQLGEHRQVAPGRLGLVERLGDPRHVVGQVADTGVDLAARDAQAGHGR